MLHDHRTICESRTLLGATSHLVYEESHSRVHYCGNILVIRAKKVLPDFDSSEVQAVRLVILCLSGKCCEPAVEVSHIKQSKPTLHGAKRYLRPPQNQLHKVSGA